MLVDKVGERESECARKRKQKWQKEHKSPNVTNFEIGNKKQYWRQREIRVYFKAGT